jgi:hypothetical protein
MLCRLLSMEQEAVSDGAFFDLLPFSNDGRVPSEVDIGGESS